MTTDQFKYENKVTDHTLVFTETPQFFNNNNQILLSTNKHWYQQPNVDILMHTHGWSISNQDTSLPETHTTVHETQTHIFRKLILSQDLSHLQLKTLSSGGCHLPVHSIQHREQAYTVVRLATPFIKTTKDIKTYLKKKNHNIKNTNQKGNTATSLQWLMT